MSPAPVYADTAGGGSGGSPVTPHRRAPIRVGVDDPVRVRRRPQVGVERYRQVVEVEQPQRGPEILLHTASPSRAR